VLTKLYIKSIFLIILILSSQKELCVFHLWNCLSWAAVERRFLACDSITDADALAAGNVLKKNITTALAYGRNKFKCDWLPQWSRRI